MTKPRKTSKDQVVQRAGTALDLLVRQFSQPLACLRELVQNSIDAGSNSIEVTLDPQPEDGCYRLSVSDTGEGMTQEIIQNQLTRLFSSQKENDLTKVGKFGIGFVSVFALNPHAVVVDTGRQGQCWRVLFHTDRSYDLIRLDENVEGTRVSLYLPNDRFQFKTLLADIEKTLTFWCRHCAVQITVNGKPVGQPFTLDEPLTVAYEEVGTRLVVAPAPGAEPFFGFYNQGLTLWEGEGGPLTHLTFKIDSRYFEHTLTRDKLIENDDYRKATRLLEKVAREQYPTALFDALPGTASKPMWSRLALLDKLGVTPRDIDRARLFRDHAGNAYSMETLKACRVFYQESADALQDAVHDPKAKRIVLRLPEHHPALPILQERAGLNVALLGRNWGLCHAEDRADLEALATACQRLSSKRLAVRQLIAVRWRGIDGPQPLVFQAVGPGAVEWARKPAVTDPVLLNVAHPNFPALQSLARWSAPLASQLILQHLILLRPEEEREALSQQLADACLARMASAR